MSSRSLSLSRTTARLLRAAQTAVPRPAPTLLSSSRILCAPIARYRAPSQPFSQHSRPLSSTTSPPFGTPQEYAVAELNEGEYHELSDYYLDLICTKYEDLQDVREDVDVEFSAGVLSISFPAIGTYVINKQPPNKQIWLSSPISGPKRYDYVLVKDEHGTEAGHWLYMRDKSSLDSLLLQETGVDINTPKGHEED